ncbi:hypothetical protein FRB97_000801 [Tulasnella sp. 331]|nr:hypothetical protein FRB97_000801 [Tulasnella sp. 331]
MSFHTSTLLADSTTASSSSSSFPTPSLSSLESVVMRSSGRILSPNAIRSAPPLLDTSVTNVTTPAAAPWAEQEVTAYRALLAVNGASIACCVSVLVAYWLIRRWYPRIMGRLSLKLVACMAATELVLHTSNLAGYGKLPTKGFLCGFVGGFFFAFGSMTALFYACAVALNCSLVFVFAKRPAQSREKYFIYGPPLLGLIICSPALASSVYGYDEELHYCWCLLALLYLLISCAFVIRAVFSPHSSALQMSATVDGFAPPDPSLSTTATKIDTFSPARRSQAIRRLVLRLLGFISVPLICVISGIILDILTKTGTEVSPHLDAGFEVVAGLMGTLNGFLFLVDPGVLAVWEFIWTEKDEEVRPRPYVMTTLPHSQSYLGTPSAWSTRSLFDLESLSMEKGYFDDPRTMRFNYVEQDLRGL